MVLCQPSAEGAPTSRSAQPLLALNDFAESISFTPMPLDLKALVSSAIYPVVAFGFSNPVLNLAGYVIPVISRQLIQLKCL